MIICDLWSTEGSQRAGKIRTAESLNGLSRSSADFANFQVAYDYNCRCEVPVTQGIATILGESLVDDAVRLSKMDNVEKILHIEKATYLDQRATNISCDDDFRSPPIPTFVRSEL